MLIILFTWYQQSNTISKVCGMNEKQNLYFNWDWFVCSFPGITLSVFKYSVIKTTNYNRKLWKKETSQQSMFTWKQLYFMTM